MQRYSMMANYQDLIEIPNEFENHFKVNLNAENLKKYESLEDRWNAIIREVNMPNVDTVPLSLSKNTFDNYYNAYNLYKWDIWLNAYFSIKYINSLRNASSTLKGISPDICTLKHFSLPFENQILSPFCSAYKQYFFTKERKEIFNVQKIFTSQTPQNDISKDIENAKFHKNLYLEAWSFKKVRQAEFDPSFDTEDSILFYKTINSNLARKLTLSHCEKADWDLSCKKEDFVHMCIEKKICELDSFAWQNLYLLIQEKSATMTLENDELSAIENQKYSMQQIEKLRHLLETGAKILENADKINKRLRILTRGLIYCILNYSASPNVINTLIDNTLKEKAEFAIEELMGLRNGDLYKFPQNEVNELRLNSKENKMLKFYAITQAKVIAYNSKYGR